MSLRSLKVGRWALSFVLASCLATVLPMMNTGTAGAAPAHAAHHSGGGGGRGFGGGGGGGKGFGGGGGGGKGYGGGGGGGKGSGGGGGGLGRGRHRSISVSGTVQSVSPSSTPPNFVIELSRQLGIKMPFWQELTAPSTTLTETSDTIDVGPQTVYREPGQPTPWGLGNILVGDSVQVKGYEADPSGGGYTPAYLAWGGVTIDATVVTLPLAHNTGTVESFVGTTLDLTVPGPWDWTTETSTSTTIAATVGGSTKYIVAGWPKPWTSADVLAGDTVRLTGSQEGTDTEDATVVDVTLAHVSGTVGTVGGTSFPLTTAKGVVYTINTTGSPKVIEPGVSSPVVASGDKVLVTGGQDGTDTVNATVIWILSDPSGDPSGHGHHWGGGGGRGRGGR